jgi:hypothetical protein
LVFNKVLSKSPLTLTLSPEAGERETAEGASRPETRERELPSPKGGESRLLGRTQVIREYRDGLLTGYLTMKEVK